METIARWIWKPIHWFFRTMTPESVCFTNVLLIACTYLFSDDLFDLASTHVYLLAINTYAFGTALLQQVVNPGRKNTHHYVRTVVDYDPKERDRVTIHRLVLLYRDRPTD